jgi:VIT1/CCC1 family predicted Fe2+/Mn2+ transporter
MTRPSHHVEPRGALQAARHYVRELIYGANDGIITTFAVVAGVTGGGLPLRVVLIIGAANLLADGLSMAVGNYLSIRAHESVLEAQALPEEEASPLRHGAATFLAFVLAGAVPLVPYMVPRLSIDRLGSSIAFTFIALFAVGASRALIANVDGGVRASKCWDSARLWRRWPTGAARSCRRDIGWRLKVLMLQ